MTIKDPNRHKVRFRGKNLYVIINPDKFEMFVSRIEDHADDDNDEVSAQTDTITRLASKLWQEHKCLNTIVEQLGKASRCKSDMPGILAVILEDYKD